MNTVTLTHKHIDVKPVTMLVETFREIPADELANYDVSFNSQIIDILSSAESLTAIGICFALGLSGYNRAIYNSLDNLSSSGKIKSSRGFFDTIYWVEH